MSNINEVAPPGWGHTKAEKEKTKPWKPKSKIGGTIAAMKRAQNRGDIPKELNIFALAYSMKKKGAKPHYKPGTDEKYKKYQEELTPMQDNNLFGNAYAGSIKKKKKKEEVKEGVPFKKFYDTAKKAISKKQKERKPQMDSTTKKLHKWRTDKEQKEREKYVTFTKPVEDD